MKRALQGLLAVLTAAVCVSTTFAYTKPITYSKDSHSIVFKQYYLLSPHAWIIDRAIALLDRDGYHEEAAEARRYLLPMLEGVTFNDVWGDADLAGASVLDYYVPDAPAGENFGFGSALFSYKNSTWDFQNHPFYGYGNAAEEAQFRYDYAKRIFAGDWGHDPHDEMAGWVIDRVYQQEDPLDGDWRSGKAQLDALERFGHGQTPHTALLDLLQSHTNGQIVFDDPTLDETLSTIYVPKKEVFDQAPEWLDEHFGDANDVEIYSGNDGYDYAVYANWTLDAEGAGPNCSGCLLDSLIFGSTCDAASMVVRLPVNSKAHAFFQLGWAIHLLEDVTTPVHTINSSITTFEVHNQVEHIADQVVADQIMLGTTPVSAAIPVDDASTLAVLSTFPPPPIYVDVNNIPIAIPCGDGAPNPADPNYFKPRWYVDPLAPAAEGVAHAYVRESAELTHSFMPYIECIKESTLLPWDWARNGFYTAYGLDLAVKSTAGLIHQFLHEVGEDDHDSPTLTLATLTASPTKERTISFSGTASDTGSGVANVEYTTDGGVTWLAATPADGAFDSLNEDYAFAAGPLVDGTYLIRARATDARGNVTERAYQPAVLMVIDNTPPAISIVEPHAGDYVHSATIAFNFSADDGAGSGVKSVTGTLHSPFLFGGRSIANGESLNLLTQAILGPHTFKVSAVDNLGNASTQTVSFNVIVTPDSLKDDVHQFVASHAIVATLETPLLARLNAAAARRAAGDRFVSSLFYLQFINEVWLQTGRKITPFASAVLIGDSQYLILH